MDNYLEILDYYLQDYSDSERDFYFKTKNYLQEGLFFKIPTSSLSNKSENFKPLNTLKPFFVLFFKNDSCFQAKYKKRKVKTSLRGNLSDLPLFLDDKIEFKIIQNNKDVFSFEGYVLELLNDFNLIINPNIEYSFYIKLLSNDESRNILEEDMDSQKYISKILTSFLSYSQSSRFVISRQKKKKVEEWLCKELGFTNFNITNISLDHLKSLSNDILILEKIIMALKYGELSKNPSKEIVNYKNNMQNTIDKIKNNELIFNTTKIVINCTYSS